MEGADGRVAVTGSTGATGDSADGADGAGTGESGPATLSRCAADVTSDLTVCV